MPDKPRTAVTHVWVVEACHKESRWMTFWATCRLTKHEALAAFNNNEAYFSYHKVRVSKFERE